MTTKIRIIRMALCAALGAATLPTLAQPMPQTTKEKIKGTATVTTEQLRGTVTYVEGNTLLVRMSSGDLREFNVPESRKFTIDGQEVSVRDLKPGTRLTATVTTTTTPVTERTTTVGSGKVWYVAGTMVILTLPNNENKMYKVQDSYRFTVDGRPATVFDLKKGMIVSAQKIVEEPRTEISSDTAVVGQAPKPRATARVAENPPPPPRRSAPPRPAAQPPAPAPTPAPPAETEAEIPASLPKTASPLPLLGLLGLAFTGASLGLRRLRSRL